jgi:mannose-6-phosphate isomerase-like protein (cupin superfamily)
LRIHPRASPWISAKADKGGKTMKQVFKVSEPYRVPDGTLVSPFLNCKDSRSGLPFDLLEGFSLAAGTIEPKTRSKIHLMPFVTQVTFVRQGDLRVRMKGPRDEDSYSLSVRTDEAVITAPGTFFQLINDETETCEVLYIVSPAYLLEMSNERVVYDDSVVFEENWDYLESSGWRPSVQPPTLQQRKEAEHRMSIRAK